MLLTWSYYLMLLDRGANADHNAPLFCCVSAQRGEEAAARKRRQAADELRKLELKIDEGTKKAEARKRTLDEKREHERAKRAAMAEAVQENRQQAHVQTIKKGIEKATRACAAVTKREKQVAEVVKRTGAQVKHALAVASAMKEHRTERAGGADEDTELASPLDSPHPSLLDSERLASPHPVHQQMQQQIHKQLQDESPVLKLIGASDATTHRSTPHASPRRQETPRRPAMMTSARRCADQQRAPVPLYPTRRTPSHVVHSLTL